MKRWQIVALIVAGLLIAGYIYYYHGGFGAGGGTRPGPAAGTSSDEENGRPARITWATVNRPDDGFKVEMPADPRDLQVPAYNETGGSEQVKMLYSNPDGETTFAVTWEDNPPVARVNRDSPEKTLDQARDGMLVRTQTTPVREANVTVSGYPGRDITAKNSGGGYLDARLIFSNDRLYTLMAVYPSISARREQDVIRFYNSFTILSAPTAGTKG
jgi:hypothetical protein